MSKINERYVSKKVVKPLREQFHTWMTDIHDTLKAQGISFTYVLVGSAKRNLVIRHHNKGFDCDYQIRVTANRNNIKPFHIKKAFMDALDPLVTANGYDYCEDSKSAITINKTGNNSNIVNGYDVVILMDTNEGMKILRNKKKDNGSVDYVFELLPDMSDARERFAQIKGPDMWRILRDIYYEKKMDELGPKATGKKSFQLLNEAVNETLDKYGR